MATVEECEQALRQLSATMAGAGSSADGLDRSVSCRVRDLDVVFTGRLRDGTLRDVVQGETAKADIRLTTSSADLLRLVEGSLGFTTAWSSGRLKVDASFFDLLKLRKML